MLMIDVALVTDF